MSVQHLWCNSTLKPARYVWRKFSPVVPFVARETERILRRQSAKRRETRRDLRRLQISSEAVKCLERVERCVQQISGDNWDYYSGTLRPQHAAVFERVISVLPSNGEVVQYLEIGSANGASMSLVAMLLKRAHPNCRLEILSIHITKMDTKRAHAAPSRLRFRSISTKIRAVEHCVCIQSCKLTLS